VTTPISPAQKRATYNKTEFMRHQTPKICGSNLVLGLVCTTPNLEKNNPISVLKAELDKQKAAA